MTEATEGAGTKPGSLKGKIKRVLSRWNGFPEVLTPILVLVVVVLAITIKTQPLTHWLWATLIIFFAIYLEIRQIGRQLGRPTEITIDTTLKKKEEDTA